MRLDLPQGQRTGDAQSALPVLPMVPLQDTNQTRGPMNLVFPGQGDGQGVIIPLDPSLQGGSSEDGSRGPPLPPLSPPNMSGGQSDPQGRSRESPGMENSGDSPGAAGGSPSGLGLARGSEDQGSHTASPTPPLSPLPEWVRARAAGRLPATLPVESPLRSSSLHDGPPPPASAKFMASALSPAVTLRLASDGSLQEVVTPLSPGAGPESDRSPRTLPPAAAPDSGASNAISSPASSDSSLHVAGPPSNPEQVGLKAAEPIPSNPTPSSSWTGQVLDSAPALGVAVGGVATAAPPLGPSPSNPASYPPTERPRDSTSSQQLAASTPVPATVEQASASPQPGAPDYANPYMSAPSLRPQTSPETAVPGAAVAPATEAQSIGNQSLGHASSLPYTRDSPAAAPGLGLSGTSSAAAWLPVRPPGGAPGPLDQLFSGANTPVGAPAPGIGPFPVEARMADGERVREYGFGQASAEAEAPEDERVLRPDAASIGLASPAAQAPGPQPGMGLPWGIANVAPAPGPQPLMPRRHAAHPALAPAPDPLPLPGPGLLPLPGLVPTSRDLTRESGVAQGGLIGPKVAMALRDRSVLPEGGGGGAVPGDPTRESGVSSAAPTLPQGLTVDNNGAPVGWPSLDSPSAGASLLFTADG